MTALNNNASGTNGVTVTTANSGLDVVTIGTNAALTYDTSEYKCSTGANSVQSFVGLTTQVTALWASGLTTHFGRFYITADALPAGTRIIAKWTDAGVTADRATIVLLATGAIRLRNSAAGTVVTTTTLISTATKYRVEVEVDGANPGPYQLHLFLGDSTTALESIVGGTANFGGAIGAGFWGWQTNSASSPNLRITGINMNDVGLPGPSSLPSAAPSGISAAVTLGQPAVSIPGVAPDGIAATVALGQPTATIPVTAPNGIAIAVTTGNPTTAIPTASPIGIAAPVALGSPDATVPSTAPDGIAGTAVPGAPATTIPGTAPDGVGTPVTLGAPGLALGLAAAPTGIATPVAVGAPTIGPTTAARDIDLTAGPPLVIWRADSPAADWVAARPLAGWHAGSPTI